MLVIIIMMLVGFGHITCFMEITPQAAKKLQHYIEMHGGFPGAMATLSSSRRILQVQCKDCERRLKETSHSSFYFTRYFIKNSVENEYREKRESLAQINDLIAELSTAYWSTAHNLHVGILGSAKNQSIEESCCRQ